MRFAGFESWHVAILAALMTLAAWRASTRASVGSGIPQLMMMLIIAALFTWAWTREFSFLMSLRDEDLPGRFDKPIWVAILFFLAPVGLFLFRSYRPDSLARGQAQADGRRRP